MYYTGKNRRNTPTCQIRETHAAEIEAAIICSVPILRKQDVEPDRREYVHHIEHHENLGDR